MGMGDEAGSNKPSEAHPVGSNSCRSDKNTETEFTGKSGMNNSSEKPPKVPDRVRACDFDIPTKKLGSASSSSLSETSSEDLFQVDTNSMGQSGSLTNSLPRPDEDSQGRFSTYQSSKGTNESANRVHGTLPTQSPPVQVMDRSGGYDPQRIPSSVFEVSKSSATQEWSVASNDSLFSIHLGNNSFSRDYFKSEDNTKSDEFLMFSPPPPIPPWESGRKSFEAIEELDESNIKDDTRSTTEDESMEKTATKSSAARKASCASIHSNGSGISTQSFAFPIKKKKKKKKKKRCCGCIPFFCCRKKSRRKCAWPSCYCSNCSCAFCHCVWPSCLFRWPSCYCSNCSCAFCYCWNCGQKRCSTDEARNCPVKSVIEKQPHATEVAAESTCCSWFSCFSCRRCRCRCCC